MFSRSAFSRSAFSRSSFSRSVFSRSAFSRSVFLRSEHREPGQTVCLHISIFVYISIFIANV